MSDDHDVLSTDNLARYEVSKAPAGFADRVLQRTLEAAAEPPIKPRRRKWAVLGATFATAAAGLTAVLFLRSADQSDVSRELTIKYVDKAARMQDTEQNGYYFQGQTQDNLIALEQGHAGTSGLKTRGMDTWKAGKQLPNTDGRFDHSNDPNTETYSKIDDNPYHAVAQQPLSTFSVDVDTASYANLRRFITEGRLPPKDAVRIEEMINYFHYRYPAPQQGEPFSVTTDVATSPWNPKYQLVRIGLHTQEIADSQVPARNLVFLLDVSGSMNAPNRLPLVKRSMEMLVENLRPQDKVTIVTYAGHSGLVLPATSGNEKEAIRNAIQRLEPGGSTNGASGIRLAYDVAVANLIKGGINRVILCTDGDFNVGVTSEGELTRLIEKERERGVFLTVLGYGMGNLKDATMEKLANRGNGNYGYIDSIDEARKVLVKEAGATLVTVAKDVKLQIEFNPAKVAGYRLVGYENRVLANKDFNDDKKDAGDIGAGHSVTALYEIIPAGLDVPTTKVDDLKYQPKTTPTATHTGELLTVKIRYKAPDATTSKLLTRAVDATQRDLASAPADFRWATAMASFGMMLRESPYRGNLSWMQVKSMAEGALGPDDEGYRKAALVLIDKASRLPSTNRP